MVGIRSLSGEEGEVAGLVEGELPKPGVGSVRIDQAGNVIASVKRSGKGPRSRMFTIPCPRVRVGVRTPIRRYRQRSCLWTWLRGYEGRLAAMAYSVPLIGEGGSDLIYASAVHEEGSG